MQEFNSKAKNPEEKRHDRGKEGKRRGTIEKGKRVPTRRAKAMLLDQAKQGRAIAPT